MCGNVGTFWYFCDISAVFRKITLDKTPHRDYNKYINLFHNGVN
jgi:hypothetical protein